MRAGKGLWAYRYFIITTVKTEFITRFSRSLFGGLWGVLNPLAQAAIYAVVLSYVLSAKLPGVSSSTGYSIHLLAGFACWSLFNDIIQRSLIMFPARASALQKVAFPRLSLPAIATAGALLDNIVLIFSVLVITSLLGHSYNAQILWLPVLMVLTAVIAAGFGLFLGLLNVFIRDVGQLVNILMQLLFWGTPIVYSLQMVPEKFAWILALNPLSYMVSSYQNVILYGRAVDPSALGVMACIALAGVLLATLAYRKSYTELMDAL